MKQLTAKNKLKIINKLKIMCWSALILAFLLKILGVYYIDKGLNVEWLINLDNFVSKHRFIEIGLNYISDTFITFMMVLIVNSKSKLNKKDTIIVFATSTICYFIFKEIFEQLSIVSDIITTFILPTFICTKNKTKAIKRTIIMFIMINVFQIISILTRTNKLSVLDDNYIYNLIMLIDYYIMFVLYYLYSIEKEKERK